MRTTVRNLLLTRVLAISSMFLVVAARVRVYMSMSDQGDAVTMRFEGEEVREFDVQL